MTRSRVFLRVFFFTRLHPADMKQDALANSSSHKKLADTIRSDHTIFYIRGILSMLSSIWSGQI